MAYYSLSLRLGIIASTAKISRSREEVIKMPATVDSATYRGGEEARAKPFLSSLG
jgi:hypothetical protein